MPIEYSQKAVEDLELIFSYIAHNSKNNAIAYINKLQSKIELLGTFPAMGTECKNKGIQKECRLLIHDAYLIFYTVSTDNIRIVRIFHHAVNYTEAI